MKRLYTGTEFFNLDPIVIKEGEKWIVAFKNGERKELIFAGEAQTKEQAEAHQDFLRDKLLRLCAWIDEAEEALSATGWTSFLTCSAMLHALTNFIFLKSGSKDDHEKMLDDFKEAAMQRLSLLRERLPKGDAHEV